jgi:hypothetical protein
LDFPIQGPSPLQDFLLEKYFEDKSLLLLEAVRDGKVFLACLLCHFGLDLAIAMGMNMDIDRIDIDIDIAFLLLSLWTLILVFGLFCVWLWTGRSRPCLASPGRLAFVPPLHCAHVYLSVNCCVRYCCIAILVLIHFLFQGVESNQVSKNGGTPLCTAALLGHVAVAQVLLEKGAKVKALNPTPILTLALTLTGPTQP